MSDFELSAPPAVIKDKNSQAWTNWLNKVYEKLRGPLWEDMLAPLANAQPRGTAPILQPFGATSITQQLEFNRGDGAQVGFHIPHNVKPGSKAYMHVHWSTDGTAATAASTDTVEWVLDYEYAKGHQQESFGNAGQITLTQSVYSGISVGPTTPDPWFHYITEASDAQAIVLPEVDSLLFVKVTRGSTSDTYDNTGNGNVFGLFVDIHYQIDRFGTPRKSPDFYKRGN